MSGVKGGYGGGGGGKVNICQDPCEPVNPCQNVTPAPVQCKDNQTVDPCQNVTPVPAQCKEIVDPCQETQGGSIGGGYGGVIGGSGGQINLGGTGIKK